MPNAPSTSAPATSCRRSWRRSAPASSGAGERDNGGMDVHGQVDARFGPVRECFAEVARGQAGTGAAFAAFCDGALVADLWGGWADQGRTRPWAADRLG